MLLILSEDDTTFTPACREDLIALMPSPTVVTDLTGGHLALMVRLEQYADLVTKIYSGADTMRRAGWSMPAGSLSFVHLNIPRSGGRW